MRYYASEEELLYFTLEGVSSREHKIVVTKWNNLSSSERNCELIPVDGRDGDLVIDKGNYKNFMLEIEIAIDATEKDNITTIAKNIKRWLNSKGYQKLMLSDDLDYYYEAKFINKLDIEEVLEQLGTASLIFSCKPYKRSNTNEVIEVTEQSAVITNTGYISKPIIKVLSSGDSIISINNQKLILKALEGEIIVDSDLMNAYRIDKTTGALVNQNQKMFSDFPLLEEGDNTITWTGNITKLEIMPNFVDLV